MQKLLDNATTQYTTDENEKLKTWLSLEPTLRPTYKSWKLSRFCTKLEHICGKTKKTISFFSLLLLDINTIQPVPSNWRAQYNRKSLL